MLLLTSHLRPLVGRFQREFIETISEVSGTTLNVSGPDGIRSPSNSRPTFSAVPQRVDICGVPYQRKNFSCCGSIVRRACLHVNFMNMNEASTLYLATTKQQAEQAAKGTDILCGCKQNIHRSIRSNA
ncbi:hypothetical protein Y032_0007g3559 [Ancylostoma ceylanicum]|uniref:Uncharacterized protein n=1 Tax=Ancylostoma ceylanicum TaxID=53326 RepID=A0A016VPW4_9BILA|nr:hypothetical protein Y032_0007g3559 [Ancylostoma ceylanicum]